MNVSECPQCGGPSDVKQKSCSFCKAPFVINSLAAIAGFDKNGVEKYLRAFKSRNAPTEEIETMLGLGLCYLNLKNYTLANIQFQKILSSSPELADAYYYLAICIIKGRRLKTLTLYEIREIEELVITAQQIDESMYKYDALLASIKYDYYRSNGMKIPTPNEIEILNDAIEKQVDEDEINSLINQTQLKDEGFVRLLLRM